MKKSLMMRALSFAIVLTMAALAPTPVPACGLFSSPIAGYEAAQTQTQFHGMDMQMGVRDDVPHLSPCCQPSMACCTVSQTLRSEAQYKSDEPPVSIGRVSANAEANTLLISKELIPAFHGHEILPPRIQSLLCVFLI